MPSRTQLLIVAALLTLVAAVSGPSVRAMPRPHSGGTAFFQNPGTAPAQPQRPSPAPGRQADGRGFGPVPGPNPSNRPDFYWWRDADIVKQIGLTSVQVATIDKLYERRLKQIQLQAEEFDKQNSELNRMISERVAKPEVIELQASKMMGPKSFIELSRIKMLYEMSLVMSTEQNKKLQDFFQRRREQQRKEQGDRGRGRNPSHQ